MTIFSFSGFFWQAAWGASATAGVLGVMCVSTAMPSTTARRETVWNLLLLRVLIFITFPLFLEHSLTVAERTSCALHDCLTHQQGANTPTRQVRMVLLPVGAPLSLTFNCAELIIWLTFTPQAALLGITPILRAWPRIFPRAAGSKVSFLQGKELCWHFCWMREEEWSRHRSKQWKNASWRSLPTQPQFYHLDKT